MFVEPRKQFKWYAIDLDGCLAEAVWPEPGIGEPITANVAKLREVYDAGFNIMIYTSRHWMDYEMIEQWLLQNNIPFKMIVCGKPVVHCYVDDRNINSEESTWLQN